jgi:hypothetical protein
MNYMRTILFVVLMVFSTVMDARKIKNIAHLYDGGKRTLEIVCVDYASDATTVTFRTTKSCTPTLKVGHGIYIVDDNGQRHHAISTEGIKLDSLYVMVKGQSRKFSISFNPVDVNNKFLDIREPGILAIYGLHDKKIRVAIPEVDKSVDSDEYGLIQSGAEGYAEIEGTYHSSENVSGTVLYFDYDFLRTRIEADQYAKVDENGRFKLRFWMYAPQSVSVRKGCRNIFTSLGELYLRPGDKIQLDLYDELEGIEMSSRNLSGRKTYDRYSKLMRRLLFINILDYQRNLYNNMKNMDYDTQYADLWNCYKEDSAFTNYLCWHNKLSPFEAHLQFALFKEIYLCWFLTLDNGVKNLYRKLKKEEEDAIFLGKGAEFDGSDTTRFLQYIKRMDYAYLRLFDPDDITCMAISEFKGNARALGFLEPLQRCRDMAKDDKDRMVKTVELQCEELGRMTGWKGLPFVAQMMVANNHVGLSDRTPMDDGQYKMIRNMLTNPYCRKILDDEQQYLLDLEKSKTERK